jgi:hypothetical protein
MRLILSLLGLVLVLGLVTGACKVQVWSSGVPARSPEAGIRGVAEGLEEATRKGQEPIGQGGRTGAEKGWIVRMNAECRRRNARVAAVGRPASFSDLAQYAERLLTIDRRHDRRVASIRPPSSFAAEARWLQRVGAAREHGLQRVATSLRAGQSAGATARLRSLQLLAARANGKLIGLGLTDCVLPASGLPA